jgi:dTDP-4-amino-4,6-dideoxygalactose transaminase
LAAGEACRRRRNADFLKPNTFQEVLSLPMYAELTEGQQQEVAAAVQEAVG